jgi:hypothetical protein
MNKNRKGKYAIEYKVLVKNFIMIISLLIGSNLLAQTNKTIMGNVLNENGEMMDYYSIRVLNQNDSSFVIGGSFISEKYEFQNLKEGQYIISITSMGYSSKIIPITIEAKDSVINMQDIILLAAIQRLKT